MIRFEDVSVRYDGAPEPTVRGVDLTVEEGELMLLVGPSGVGKSTLLGAVNGLVPHFTGGTLHGQVTVAGRDTRSHKPRELADVVGSVGQDPLAHFVTDTVEDELAYAMESLGLAPEVMRRRVEETLDLLGLAELRDRPLATLSGGQQQRVAIGSVLTPHPRVLVLDEPTSALDPAAAEEVLAVLQRLVHDLGTTVLLAEHRLERVVQYADRVALLAAPGAELVTGPPAEVMAVSPVRPPVVALGALAGWDPLPLTVRDARRRAAGLRERLAEVPVPPPGGAAPAGAPGDLATPRRERRRGLLRGLLGTGRRQQPDSVTGEPYARVSGLAVRRGRVEALREVSLSVAAGETVALMGRNGAGKSTLLGSLVGMVEPFSGTVRVGGLTPHRTRPQELIGHVGLVPQDPRDLLSADTVAAECAAADADAAAEPGTCRALVARLLPGIDDATHPRDLSEGQRLTLALSIVLTARPPLILLDEPTRGLDYAAKARLVDVLRDLVSEGHAVVLATHDVELAAELAHRVVILAEGEPVADGPTADVVRSSPSFAPQVTKIMAPQPWLTVSQVETALSPATAAGTGSVAMGPGGAGPEVAGPEIAGPEIAGPEVADSAAPTQTVSPSGATAPDAATSGAPLPAIGSPGSVPPDAGPDDSATTDHAPAGAKKAGRSPQAAADRSPTPNNPRDEENGTARTRRGAGEATPPMGQAHEPPPSGRADAYRTAERAGATPHPGHDGTTPTPRNGTCPPPGQSSAPPKPERAPADRSPEPSSPGHEEHGTNRLSEPADPRRPSAHDGTARPGQPDQRPTTGTDHTAQHPDHDSAPPTPRNRTDPQPEPSTPGRNPEKDDTRRTSVHGTPLSVGEDTAPGPAGRPGSASEQEAEPASPWRADTGRPTGESHSSSPLSAQGSAHATPGGSTTPPPVEGDAGPAPEEGTTASSEDDQAGPAAEGQR